MQPDSAGNNYINMTYKHIIFNASVLAKFPQTETFFKTARNSSMGATAYIRSHCAPRADMKHALELIRRKGIEIIVLCKTAAGAGQVLDALGIPYGRTISSLDEIKDETSDYAYVTPIVKECGIAHAQGVRAVRFVPDSGQNPCDVISLAGYRQLSNL